MTSQEKTTDKYNVRQQPEMPSINLPKGGGAIQGIGEKFSANPVSGTGSMSFPIYSSPGRSGFGPTLSLSYDSGSGNGPFGFGWTLSIPSITRKTDKGLPEYDDAKDSDVFIFSGTEDLVPVLNDDGAPPQNIRLVDGQTYRITSYRPRIEGLFARIERWMNVSDSKDIHWRSISKDNILTLYGKDSNSQIFNPEHPEQIFSWLICESRDDKGNAIVYEYKPEDGAGIDLNRTHERNRGDRDDPRRTANRYLKRIRYGNRLTMLDEGGRRPAFLTSSRMENAEWMFELVFDYGEHDDDIPTSDESGEWTVRQDPFSTYRAGFEIRTLRLCRRVLMFHHFPGIQDVGNDCLVRTTDFTYSRQHNSGQPDIPIYSFLTAVAQTGYKREDNGYLKRGLPPVGFEYSKPVVQDKIEEIDPADLENLPTGLDGTTYQWTDLHGEGIPGILTEQGGSWYYKRNLSPLPDRGNGPGSLKVRFSAVEHVSSKPNLTLANGARLTDISGDGQPDLVVMDGPLPGFYGHGSDEDWQDFRPFTSYLKRNYRDPNLKFIDLDGDGRADVLITEDDAFVWHTSLSGKGFGRAQRVAQAIDEEKGPRLIFADGTQSIYLADMSGDGLTDLVRIRDGEICYWPNLGYCRFGQKITMENAPHFDQQDQFDQRRIRLTDIDGSGTSDIIYLHRDGVRLYFNQSGNGWSAPQTVKVFPRVDDLNSIFAVDLLGNGIVCLVWSSFLQGDAGRHMRYVNLIGGKKPHLLVKMTNNLGSETEIEYAPSTKFYLQDKVAGKPWITKLPFPVHVVEKVTVTDRWRQTRFSSTYSYHHGYFDGEEREFRGFGRVEQTDVEDFGKFAAGNASSPYISDDQTLYQPPVKTVSWFHTGCFTDRRRILAQYEDEYFSPRSDKFTEAALPEPDLTTEEWREALRACKGMLLRQEVYELDVDSLKNGEERRVKLFSTAFQNYHIQCLQRREENRHAVFLVTESEKITCHYELNLQTESYPDPRITHTLNLRIDEYGNVLESVDVAYPRIEQHSDTLLPEETIALIAQVQQERHIVYRENRFTNDAIGADDYRLRMPCEVKTYEVTGLNPTTGFYFTMAELRKVNIPVDVAEIAYHLLPDRVHPQKRTLAWERMLYFSDDLQTPLPFGQLNTLGLSYENYKLALTGELLDAVYSDRLTAEIRSEIDNAGISGYLSGSLLEDRFPDTDTSGQYWIRSGIAGFNAGASAHFYLPVCYYDAFGNETTLEYDSLDLYIRTSTDPLGNSTEVLDFDYRVLAPRRIRDLNGNVSEVRFDILGIPAAMAVQGKGNEADDLSAFDDSMLLHPDLNTLIAFFTGDYSEPEARRLLNGATARHLYYFGERLEDDGSISYGHHPACGAGITREIHLGQGGANSPLQSAFEYSDGSGNVLVMKIQAEPETEGGPLRWIANGKTILNNKGNPVKQYEPYFSPSGHRYEESIEAGVTPVLYYDPAGRQFRVEMPDGTYSRVEFSPWHIENWDANDTVLEQGNSWYDRYAGGTPEKQRAAQLTTIHAYTPAVTHLDSLGRDVVAIAHNKMQRDGTVTEEKYITYTKLDAEGKPLWIRDARGNRVMEYIDKPGADTGFVPCYDIAGNLLFQHSMDGGDRWVLPDASGKPFYSWDVNERVAEDGSLIPENRLFHIMYDVLRRPKEQRLRINEGQSHIIEQFIYGDEQGLFPSRSANEISEAQERNLRGHVYKHYDSGGLIVNQYFDFKGNLLEITRQLTQSHGSSIIDWSTEIPSEEVFTRRTGYDALNRVTRLENWHLPGRPPATHLPQYNARGLLEREDLLVSGTTQTEAIDRIEYNEKGQRTRIQYGNGTETSYYYNPLTFRLEQLRTTRTVYEDDLSASTGSAGAQQVLQNLRYTYDGTGNITEIRDDAHEPVFFRNQEVEPRSLYEYDALYRLIKATGRENYAANDAPGPFVPEPYEANFPVNDQALRNYTQRYSYDSVGNILQIRHVADSGGWTRHYEYAADSNRLLKTRQGDRELDEVHYEYDTHGSMLNLMNAPDAYRLRWDYRDMIYNVNLGGGGQAFYNYDAGKQRTRKRIERNGNRIEERIYFDGMEYYRRWVGGALSEEIETHHLFADDQRILIVEDVIRTDNPALSGGILFRYQYGNHLGSVGLECDGSGRIISYEEYHPYGTTAYQAVNKNIKSVAKRYRYTGMERDEETGLAYHTARYYVPWLGRWTSTDHSGVSDGLNLFLYDRNNPIRFIDTNGQNSLDQVNNVAYGVGGAISNKINSAYQGVVTLASNFYSDPLGTTWGIVTESIPGKVLIQLDPWSALSDVMGEISYAASNVANIVRYGTGGPILEYSTIILSGTQQEIQSATENLIDDVVGMVDTGSDIASSGGKAVLKGAVMGGIAKKSMSTLSAPVNSPRTSKKTSPASTVATSSNNVNQLSTNEIIWNVQPGDPAVTRASLILQRGRQIPEVQSLQGIKNIEKLTIVGHGNPNSVAGMDARVIAERLKNAGLSPQSIELVSCNSGSCGGNLAKDLARYSGSRVTGYESFVYPHRGTVYEAAFMSGDGVKIYIPWKEQIPAKSVSH